MTYNIDKTPTFTVPVEVTDPDGETGDFAVTFRALDLDVFQDFDLETADGVRAFLDEAVEAIDGLVDKDGEPVPDSSALRAALYNRSWVRPPMVRAYLEGITKASRGN